MMMTSKLEEEMEIVKRHTSVLKAVMENQPIGIIKLSQILGIPDYKVRYSLKILEQERMIEPTPEGAKITKRARKEIREIRESLERIIRDAQEIVEALREMER